MSYEQRQVGHTIGMKYTTILHIILFTGDNHSINIAI